MADVLLNKTLSTYLRCCMPEMTNVTSTDKTNYSFLLKMLAVSAAIIMAAATTVALMLQAAATPTLLASSSPIIPIIVVAILLIALVALILWTPSNGIAYDNRFYVRPSYHPFMFRHDHCNSAHVVRVTSSNNHGHSGGFIGGHNHGHNGGFGGGHNHGHSGG
ncbi:MAG: hypothetical protein ACRC0M_08945, partial [Legionella sp.]